MEQHIQANDGGPFQAQHKEEKESGKEEQREREREAASEKRMLDSNIAVLQDAIQIIQEQNTRELLSLRNEQHLKEAEAANQLRGAQEALTSRNKRVKALKRQVKEKETESERYISELEREKKQISHLEVQLEQREAMIQTLNSRLKRRDNQIKKLEESLEALKEPENEEESESCESSEAESL
ncbi:switch-associated protein 70-like [Penaeus chinensis]|uniref:switch-associated protein 70-like n=1 Tax=Penaeus chinensis TaxID=139456 RepID=UPI001FB84FD4|nr:switch-associated protein 70-like [Penaeus chinensis]